MAEHCSLRAFWCVVGVEVLGTIVHSAFLPLSRLQQLLHLVLSDEIFQSDLHNATPVAIPVGNSLERLPRLSGNRIKIKCSVLKVAETVRDQVLALAARAGDNHNAVIVGLFGELLGRSRIANGAGKDERQLAASFFRSGNGQITSTGRGDENFNRIIFIRSRFVFIFFFYLHCSSMSEGLLRFR